MNRMFAYFIIAAMVGTRDLGQEVFKSLAKADVGRGIIAGLCVAFIGIVADPHDIFPAAILDHEILVRDAARERLRIDDALPAGEGGRDRAGIRGHGLVHRSSAPV